MARPAQFLRWQQTLSTYLPHLSRPQVTVLALWSMGLILADSRGLTTVATVLAYLLARCGGMASAPGSKVGTRTANGAAGSGTRPR